MTTNTAAAINSLSQMTVPQLRRVWTAACREMGCTTRQAIGADKLVRVDPVELCRDLLHEVVYHFTKAIPTGRTYWTTNAFHGSQPYRTREMAYDTSAADAAIARIMAAAA